MTDEARPADDASTPGPEATPDQDAHVRSLLGMLGPDDLPAPDDVVRRLDAVLDQERRHADAAGGPGTATASTDGADDPAGRGGTGDGGAQQEDTATVLPLDAAARRRRNLGVLGWSSGAAAAILLFAGGFALIARPGLTHGSADSGAVTTVAGGQPPTVMSSSDTAYAPATLRSQVTSLVAGARTAASPAAAGAQSPAAAPSDASAPAVAPESATSSSKAAFGADSSAPASGSAAPLTAGTLPACLVGLGLPGATAVVVDHGTFEGKPADVVVVPDPEDATVLDVFVLHPGCDATTPLVYEYTTIPAG
ncbi:MAG: hypothetical protein GC157_10810 [Frankiales bacterium]|nr:hypothetical protein [Frankiales bacterium]